MGDKNFRSSLSGHLQAFVDQKQAAGYTYRGNIGKLRIFDDMVAEKFPDASTVTKDMNDSWLSLRSIYPRTLLNDANAVRQFSKYLNGIGVEAYVLPYGSLKVPPRYEPHIYTDKEKAAFFRSIDECKWSKYSPTKSYVVPMIFRMIYCCGLRSSEARKLYREDVDLKTGKVLIRASKFWQERVIYTSWDLLENLRDYEAVISKVMPDRIAFFPNRKGQFFSSSVIDDWFHEFWDPLPEASRIIGNSPRVHDWRHTYFTDRMDLWVKEGSDINSLEMYLSEYVGHSHYAADDYYQHLTASFYPEMEKRMSVVNRNILPEVPHEK